MERSQVLNLVRVQELETWLKTTNTKLTQVNGQRKYGGPPELWSGPTPGARCEVFIGQIPRDAYEDLLIPLFSSVGPLWEFRLMMNFSGQNRGFAYAKYSSPTVADNAVRLLNGYMLQSGFCLNVRRSTEKRHLCMGDLPGTTRQEDLLQVLRVLTEGVKSVSLKSGPGIERSSAIVTFSSHHTASMAKRMLAEAFKKQFDLTISVNWQPMVKPGLDETLLPQNPLKSLLPSLSNPLRQIRSSPQPSHLPRHQACPPSTSPNFCRIVGGPTSPQLPSLPNPPLLPTPIMLLHNTCESTGLGQPLYEMRCSHASPDGFIYFNYKVCIPGIAMAFEGQVMILPGPTPTTTLEEAQQAAAQQVMQRMYNNTV